MCQSILRVSFRDIVERRFWSGTFFVATGIITVMVLLPSLQVLLESRPILWLFAFILSSKYRVRGCLPITMNYCVIRAHLEFYQSINKWYMVFAFMCVVAIVTDQII